MTELFRPNPFSTIRLQAATVAGAAPPLPNLAIGGASDVLIANRGTVPALIEFGAGSTMALPTAPTDAVAGSQSVPAGAMVLQRLQRDQRHVAIVGVGGAPDVEIQVGQGGGGAFTIGAASGGTSIPGVVDAAPAPGSPITITGTGPTASFTAVGYPTIAVELMSGSVSLQLESSNDDPGVPDAAAVWRAVAGTDPNQPSAQATTTAIGTGAPRRSFAKLARRYRLNCTTFVSGPATVAVILSTTPPTERGAYVYGGSLALTAGSAVIGSTALRSAGTNRSAAVGTTAVTLMPANPNRQGWKVKNDSTGDIWISFDGTATAAAGGGNIRIPPGGYLASEPGFVETGAMSAIGSAAGLAVTAREH